MQEITLPVLSGHVNLSVPDAWEIEILSVRDTPEWTDAQIEDAFDHPIDMPSWKEIVRGKERIMIVSEDAMRPAPVHRVAPVIVRRLLEAGAKEDRIKFILGIGTHRVQTGRDAYLKLGAEIVDRFEVLPHSPYANLIYLGESPRGIPVWVNRWVAESDLVLSIGGTLPHSGAGFGGGAKTVMPGVCGIETIGRHHEGIPRGGYAVEGNVWREEIESIARMIGLEYAANIVINGKAKVAGVFVGDMVLAHREAAKLAESICRVNLPDYADIVLASGFPLDQELGQSRKAFWIASKFVSPDGSVVLFGDCPEGGGCHGLYNIGSPYYEKVQGMLEDSLKGAQPWVCSPWVTAPEARHYLPSSTIVIRDPEELIARLEERHPRARVCVMKQGPMLMA